MTAGPEVGYMETINTPSKTGGSEDPINSDTETGVPNSESRDGLRNGLELSWPARITMAALSAGAAAMHFAMAPAHAAEWLPLGIGFAISGWFQLVFSLAVVARPSRRWLQVNVLFNLAFIAVWAVSRTIGLPVGPEAGHAEAISIVDGLCVGFEALMVLGSAMLLARPKVGSRLSIPKFIGAAAVPALAVITMTTAALASPAGQHDHGSGHDDHGAVSASDHGVADDHGSSDPTVGDHDTAAMDHGAGGMDHGHEGDSAAGATAADHVDDHGQMRDPLSAGTPALSSHDHANPATGDITHLDSDGHMHMECTAPVTAGQQAAADKLVGDTQGATVKYRDFNKALADGYTPITPPNSQMVHYGNLAYMTDGNLLDPSHVESLMYAFDAQRTPYFIGSMYLNDTPTVTPPEIGGCLTQWHDHTNLCLAPGKGMVGVAKADGTCPAGSSNDQTSQMIHVWSIPLPTGPLTMEAKPADVKAAIIKAKKKGSEWLADRVYSGIPAGMFGLKQIIEVGPMSGLSNVVFWLSENGYPQDESLATQIFQLAKSTSRLLSEEELHNSAKSWQEAHATA